MASGPAGVQRYSAWCAGSTFGTGGMHSHVFGFVEVQHGLWSRTSTALPMRRRNLYLLDLLIRWIMAYLDKEHSLYTPHRQDAPHATTAALELLLHKAEQSSIRSDRIDRILEEAFPALCMVCASQKVKRRLERCCSVRFLVDNVEGVR